MIFGKQIPKQLKQMIIYFSLNYIYIYMFNIFVEKNVEVVFCLIYIYIYIYIYILNKSIAGVRYWVVDSILEVSRQIYPGIQADKSIRATRFTAFEKYFKK